MEVLVGCWLLTVPWPVAADDAAREAQEQLRRRNLYFGDVDGHVNNEFRAALRQYQERKSLRVTGELDDETSRSLNLPATSSPADAGADAASARHRLKVARHEENDGSTDLTNQDETRHRSAKASRKPRPNQATDFWRKLMGANPSERTVKPKTHSGSAISGISGTNDRSRTISKSSSNSIAAPAARFGTLSARSVDEQSSFNKSPARKSESRGTSKKRRAARSSAPSNAANSSGTPASSPVLGLG